MSAIRLYHSFRSPYSRLGVHLINQAGLEVDLIPFSEPPEGTPFIDPMANKVKMAYISADVMRMTARLGLPLKFPKEFEADLVPSYRAAIAASRDGVGMAFAIAVYEARWGEGKNIADIDVLADCANVADWDRAGVEAAQSDADIDAALKRHRALITEDMVFGVPFAVAGGQKYWGHDRFNLLLEDIAA